MEDQEKLENMLETAKMVDALKIKLLDFLRDEKVSDLVGTFALLSAVIAVVKVTYEENEKEGLRMQNVMTQFFVMEMEAALNDVRTNKR